MSFVLLFLRVERGCIEGRTRDAREEEGGPRSRKEEDGRVDHLDEVPLLPSLPLLLRPERVQSFAQSLSSVYMIPPERAEGPTREKRESSPSVLEQKQGATTDGSLPSFPSFFLFSKTYLSNKIDSFS